MAKKEEEFKYLTMPLPDSEKYYKSTKRSWSGFNRKYKIDTGLLSMESNISTSEAPYLIPSQKWIGVRDARTHPIGLFGFSDFLLCIYRSGSIIYVDYIKYDKFKKVYKAYSGILKEDADNPEDETAIGLDDYPRSVVQFNVYDVPTDPISSKYTKKILIFPDKKSMDFDIKHDFKPDDLSIDIKTYTNNEEPYLPPDGASHNYYYKNTFIAPGEKGENIYRWIIDDTEPENTGWKVVTPPTIPNIEYATVHASRLFGVGGGRVYASGFNNYANWNLDTAEEYNETNSWCSPTQADSKSDGNFTGITAFMNHVICFKKDFMHELYNTKNPFRIQDIFAEGAVDNRTIQDVDGKLIFCSDDNVKIYTGSNPRAIGDALGIKRFINPVGGSDGRSYYLYCEDENDVKHMFIYDTYVEEWSEQAIEYSVLNFAHNSDGMFALCTDGIVYKLNSDNYRHNWSFETDLMTGQTVDIKHLKKIQLLSYFAGNARLKIYALYDDEEFDEEEPGKYHLLYSGSGSGGGKQNVIRVKPRQTAHYGFKLHFEGYGYIRLYEMELFTEGGGALYVGKQYQ